MKNHKSSNFDTKVIHGAPRHPNLTDVVAPIHPTTIFNHPETGMDASQDHYIRSDNPNRRQLEELCTGLEDGSQAAAFASGMAAIAAVFQALEPGDHLILPQDVYHGTRTLVKKIMHRWNLQFDEVDTTDLERVRQSITQKTRLIWLETPSNPMLHITDISAIAELARELDSGIQVAVDNTWPSPALQQPLNLGADISVHSATKYLGGHSDILGGVVINKQSDEMAGRIRDFQQQAGGVLSPHDSWMLVRSIKTLGWRMKGHCLNARKIAGFLSDHPKVTKVYYPGLKDHHGHDIAQKQMSDFGGMISFEIYGSAEDALRMVAKAKIITSATSLGGVESIWEHRRSSESDDSQTPEALIRLSVGLEDVDDLIEDISMALG